MRDKTRILRVIMIISFLIIFCSENKGCSVVCEFPVDLKDGIYIGEGIIIGYQGDYTQNEIEGGFGMIKVAITKLYYPRIKVDTVYISEFSLGAGCEVIGISVEYFKNIYSMKKVVSFVGQKSHFFGDSIIHLTIKVCDHLFLGSMKDRINYDYESLRKSPSLNEQL